MATLGKIGEYLIHQTTGIISYCKQGELATFLLVIGPLTYKLLRNITLQRPGNKLYAELVKC